MRLRHALAFLPVGEDQTVLIAQAGRHYGEARLGPKDPDLAHQSVAGILRNIGINAGADV
jgi:hypothetical protein